MKLDKFCILILSSSLIILSNVMTFSGCSSSGEMSSRSGTGAQIVPDDRKKDLALQHFIAGSVLEAKDDHANAIVEYQDALRFDNNATILYAIAKNYLELAKPSLAAQYARAAVDLEPSNVHYLEKLAEVFIASFQTDSAIVQYEKILLLEPSNTQAMFTLARLYSASKPLEALLIYNRIRDHVGDEWDVLYRISELYGQLGKIDSTIVMMETMLNIDPGNITLRGAIADLYMQQNKTDQARTMFEDLVERDPGETRYVIALAEIERKAGHWDKAVDMYNKLLQNDSLRIEGKMQIAEAFLQTSITDTTLRPYALKIFNQLKETYPNDWRPYWYLGAYQFNIREYEAAIPFFKRTLEVDPKNLQAHQILAQTYINLNNYDDAKEILEKAITIDENNADLYSLLGFIFNRMGDNQKTISTLEHALRINPKHMDALSTLALTFDGMKNFSYSDSLYESALKMYEHDLPKDGVYYLLLNNYAYSLSERELQLERALEMSKKSIEFEKENSSYLDTFGWIYFKLGRYDDALKYISQAVDIRENKDKQPASALYEHLGDVYFKFGDKEKAMKYWTKALEQDKTNTALQEKIAKGSL